MVESGGDGGGGCIRSRVDVGLFKGGLFIGEGWEFTLSENEVRDPAGVDCTLALY